MVLKNILGIILMANKTLIAGEKIKINDYVTSQHYEVHIQIESSMTIDICCFGLDSNKKLSDDRYMIFYNQTASPEGAIRLSANDHKKSVFLTHPNKLSSEIKNLVFTASIDGNGTMSNISKGYLAVFVDSREIFKFDFSGQDFKNERAIIIGEIYFKEVWRLGAVGQGFNGGLSALLKHFGGEELIEANENVLGQGYKYYYNKLNEPTKKAYEAILKGMKEFSDNIHIGYHRDIDESSINKLFEYIGFDNPSIFYLESNYQISTDGNNIWFKPHYQFDQSTIERMASKLINEVDRVIGSVIKNAMSDYEKELAFHDYLVTNVYYDEESLTMQNPPREIYSAYGALMNKKAVCSGYAHAMKLLLDKCNIQCLIVSGKSKKPGNEKSELHGWNIVKINDNTYHLDVTWDAPVGRKAGELNHHYFNVTDENISIDHEWNSETPKCNSTEHNYFKYNGLIISDEAILKKKI